MSLPNDRPRLLRLLILILFCTGSTIFSQQAATTNLSGTIKDPNGALVAGAKVSVKFKDTSVTRETTSNDNGVFVITNLAAGSYSVKVAATGFAEKTLPDVDLQVGQTTTLDIAVTLTVEETVTLDHQFNYELV